MLIRRIRSVSDEFVLLRELLPTMYGARVFFASEARACAREIFCLARCTIKAGVMQLLGVDMVKGRLLNRPKSVTLKDKAEGTHLAMLEKPDLQDESIISCLTKHYGLGIKKIEFLPIGNDATAWVYRVYVDGAADHFLKVKKGEVHQPSLLVPRFLQERGIQQVVAPIPSVAGSLSQSLAQFSLVLYPFIEGLLAAEAGLSETQWTEFGAVLRRMHSTKPTPEITASMSRETFVPKWASLSKRLHREVMQGKYDGPTSTEIEHEMAAFWRGKSDEIVKIIARTEELGLLLQARGVDYVICHADIHTSNVLVDQEGELFIVDWDELIIAPKERDLMFFVDKIVDGRVVGDKNSDSFFAGYGETGSETEVDPIGISYYRYEWVVQEFGDYGERVFLSTDGGEETKNAALAEFVELFQAGDVVDGAYASEEFLP